MGRIVTFYSYKGGTGRSFLLANVAWILASTGRRILLVDWDLEAPGLHNYFHPFLRDPFLTTNPGLIDWVSDYQSIVTDLPEDSSEVPLDILDRLCDPTPYILAMDLKEFDLPRFGALHLLPAGQQSGSYPDVVNRFDWVRLYERLGGQQFFLRARKQMAAKYDYVLIDSRTGLSDTSGISTLEMPDDLVVCFTLNNQGIRGASEVARTAAAKLTKADAEIFPVATRIDRSEKLKLQAARRFAREAFQGLPRQWRDDDDANDRYWGQVEVPYDSFYSYQEVLVPFADEPVEIASVLAAAERLTGYLIRDSSLRMPRLDGQTRKRILGLYLRGVDTSIDLQQSASQVIARLTLEQIESAKALLLQFIDVGPDGLISAKPVLTHDLNEDLRPILKEFQQDGVIVAGGQGENVLELADPRLPTTWRRLSRWIDSERDYLQWQAGVRYRAATWERSGRADNLLLSEAERSEAQKWLTTRRPDSALLEFIRLRASKQAMGSLSEQWLLFAPKPRPLDRGETWHVFLSYGPGDRSWVLSLNDVLQQLGFAVFWDQLSLIAGDSVIRQLERGLGGSQAAILILSRNTPDSDWIRAEFHAMERVQRERKNFRFVPLRLDQSPLPLFARGRVFLDFSDYPDGPNGGELLRLLYAITDKPLTVEAARFATEQDATATQQASAIAAAIRNSDPELLEDLYASGDLTWETSPALSCKAAEGLIRLGRYENALVMLERIRTKFPRAIRPRQLQALALLRRAGEGDLRQSQHVLGALYESGARDPETLGMYGQSWMRRYQRSRNLSDLAQSRDLYAEAFERAPDDYYTGINAAAKSLLLGTEEDLGKAQEYVDRVRMIVGTEPVRGDFWITATAGELFLLVRDYKNAARLYKEAVAMARSERGSHEAIWRQACELMNKLQPSIAERSLIRSVFEHLPDC